MPNARETYRAAVDGLVSGNAAIRNRLVQALNTLSVLQFNDMPEDLRPDFKRMWNLINALTDPTGRGPIVGFVNSLSEEQAGQFALGILRTHEELNRRQA